MALIQCPQCGQRISDRAADCPHCGKKKQSKKKLWISAGCGILAVLIAMICILLENTAGVEHEAKSILEDDLGTSIDILELYYNEEEQGCFVKFKTKSSRDEAAVRLDTKKVDYESEFNYYSDRAETLRQQNPIDETELHKCNQKILDSLYAKWGFTIAAMKYNGETEWNGWIQLK